jgi:hypothetical protein
MHSPNATNATAPAVSTRQALCYTHSYPLWRWEEARCEQKPRYIGTKKHLCISAKRHGRRLPLRSKEAMNTQWQSDNFCASMAQFTSCDGYADQRIWAAFHRLLNKTKIKLTNWRLQKRSWGGITICGHCRRIQAKKDTALIEHQPG